MLENKTRLRENGNEVVVCFSVRTGTIEFFNQIRQRNQTDSPLNGLNLTILLNMVERFKVMIEADLLGEIVRTLFQELPWVPITIVEKASNSRLKPEIGCP